MKTFEVLTQSLEGKHIIEASAGTGKTYSIAILYLRMLLEKDIPVEKILVVTFTNAAVAELRVRIRSFIQSAYQHIENVEAMKDKEMRTLLKNVMEKESDVSKIKDRLKLALLSMDLAQIITIHGFCQQMLSEYAFETSQRFSAELQTDADEIIEEVSLDFWRDVYTQLEVEVIRASSLNIKMLKDCLSKSLKGAQFGSMQEGVNLDTIFNFYKNKHEIYKNKLEEIRNEIPAADQQIIQLYELHINEHLSICQNARKNNILYKRFFPLIQENDKNEFITLSKEQTTNANREKIKNLNSEYIDSLEIFRDLMDRQNKLIKDGLKITKEETNNILISFALQAYTPKIKNKIIEKGILTYDSLIENLHQYTVSNPNDTLISKIRAKFNAVFIDEFQDTDTLQFDIFDKLFVDASCPASLFLIGDPKQSIYGFRGADVEAYLDAKNKIPEENRYTMNVNFRSNKALIQKFNFFFNSINDPFANENTIDYLEVNHSENIKNKLTKDEIDESTLKVFNYDSKDHAVNASCNAISALLDPAANYNITEREHTAIKPSDICVLVRTGKQGTQVKNQLQALNIPAIQILEESIFDTSEANDIAYLLEAMITPQRNLIQKVFVLSFARKVVPEGYDNAQLGQNEYTFQRFFGYKNSLQSENVFVAFSQFLNDYNIRYLLTENNATLRILSNVEQLIQVLQDQQYRSQCSATELLLWLHKKISSAKENTFTTEIESDEDAVQIVTIHKSKGLQYNIVFVIGLDADLQITHHIPIKNYRKEKNKYFDIYANLNKPENKPEKELCEKQALEENRRLLYVAMTRAKYACYLFISDKELKRTHCLSAFLKEEVQLLLETNQIFEQTPFIYDITKQPIQTIAVPRAITKAYSNWWKMSYSHLADHSNKLEIIDGVVSENPYDNYIFSQLKKGAYIGTKLHSIFENINFLEDFNNLETLSESAKKEISSFNKKNADETIVNNAPYIQALINHCLTAKIAVGDNKTLSLNSLGADQKLVELGFNFNVKNQTATLKAALEKHVHPTTLKSGIQLDGILNGFIDLFFEQDGKYYILDWKSNYLGNTLAHYTTENVVSAMSASNYHLQYLIYTVAVHKFLKSRLLDYDYDLHFGGAIYLFLRGVRKDGNTGIFFHKPAKELVEELADTLSLSATKNLSVID